MGQDERKSGILQRILGIWRTDEPRPLSPKAAYNYGVLPEITAILTNGSERAISDMQSLAEDMPAFVKTRREWCVEMDYADFGVNPDLRQEESLLLLAYWLTGYQATGDKTKDPLQFGAYIDWKEETDDVLRILGEADKNLGYGLDLGQIKFDYTEFTDHALQMIDEFLSKKGLALTSLDTQSDCYHLFVLRGEHFDKLTRLAKQAGFRFFRNF